MNRMTYVTVPVQVEVVVATLYKVSVFVGVGAVMETTGAVASPLKTVRTGGVLVDVTVEPTVFLRDSCQLQGSLKNNNLIERSRSGGIWIELTNQGNGYWIGSACGG